jgi:hypothetical protein
MFYFEILVNELFYLDFKNFQNSGTPTLGAIFMYISNTIGKYIHDIMGTISFYMYYITDLWNVRSHFNAGGGMCNQGKCWVSVTYGWWEVDTDQSNDGHVTNSIFPPHDFCIGTLSLALYQARRNYLSRVSR